ncbi:MAG: EAL domain-containing protein [Chromatiaceae bacterium]|nr:EAL domain-containing protein [Chromatiaceae bacterium]
MIERQQLSLPDDDTNTRTGHARCDDPSTGDSIDDASVQDLDQILVRQSLTPAFAPIAELRLRDPYGYRGQISGPTDSPLRLPLTLFGVAEHCGRSAELTLAVLNSLATQFRAQGLGGKLFYRLRRAALYDPGFCADRLQETLTQAGLEPDRLVLGLSEHRVQSSLKALSRLLADLRVLGIQWMLCGFGDSHGALLAVQALRPDYIELGRGQIEALQLPVPSLEFARATLDVARRFNALVVATGIDTEQTLRAAEALGIPLLQGNSIGALDPAPRKRLRKKLFCGAADSESSLSDAQTATVAGLATEIPPVCSDYSVEEVGEVFHAARQLQTLPVVEKGKPLGLVRRMDFMNLFLSRYGRDLHGRKPIRLFMDTKPVMVEHDTPISEVSQKLTDHNQSNTQTDFLITRNGRYLGVGYMVDLLREITALQLQTARHANPLSGLPGNVPINQQINDRLRQGRAFVVVYVDLDHFKPFNDAYGYSKGDEVIVAVATLLLSECGMLGDFVGHVGGDDFVILFEDDDWETRCRRILATFEAQAPSFYRETDRENGGLWGEDRQGGRVFFPFLSLSLGAVRPDPDCCDSFHDVATMAADAKHMAKQQAGNSLFIERRCGPHRVA